jgi:hypothetical protein
LRGMEMTQSFSNFQSSQPESLAHPREATIYMHPDDVTSDPKLTTAAKKAVLASWISDARAIENVPSLRRLDSGAVVDVDAILKGLRSLDELTDDYCGNGKQLLPSARRRSVVLRWLRRGGSSGSIDDDDDPPPAPAGVGIPFRPKPLPSAHSARPQWVPELACA